MILWQRFFSMPPQPDRIAAQKTLEGMQAGDRSYKIFKLHDSIVGTTNLKWTDIHGS